ncbi:MAG: bifunctional metallophosphatase/5'-nucleotidase [Bacteroidota bacterium]
MKWLKPSMVLLFLIALGCKTPQPVAEAKEDHTVTFKFVQLNDVYEIAPLSGGKYGGMARVAHVFDSIRAVEPNTFMVMAGDFLNPSLLGTLKVDGQRIAGKQMIEVMNAMNFELATFGNHEFDLDEEVLQQRLDESNFYWTSANVFQNNPEGPRSFFFRRNNDTIYVPETYTIPLKANDGSQVDIGLFGVTLPSNPKDYVYYADIFLEARSAYTALKMQQVDVIVGLTHLEIEQDVELANQLPDVELIMGGHEHNNMLVPTDHAIVAKADANAKTIYIHSFVYNTKTGKVKFDSHLMPIDHKIASKPEVAALVGKWNAILDDKIKEVVDRPNEVIYHAKPPLDGTDGANRSIQTNLGAVITGAMKASYNNEVDLTLVNGGSFRVDDMLAGDLTSIDVFRILPFGGQVLKVDMTGELLTKVLDYGKSARDSGAYLQRKDVGENAEGKWLVDGNLIDPGRTYSVAISDFLLKGFDIPFLTHDHKGVIKVHTPKVGDVAFDIRKSVIVYLKSLPSE